MAAASTGAAAADTDGTIAQVEFYRGGAGSRRYKRRARAVGRSRGAHLLWRATTGRRVIGRRQREGEQAGNSGITAPANNAVICPFRDGAISATAAVRRNGQQSRFLSRRILLGRTTLPYSYAQRTLRRNIRTDGEGDRQSWHFTTSAAVTRNA
jgi:hypothetical protein